MHNILFKESVYASGYLFLKILNKNNRSKTTDRWQWSIRTTVRQKIKMNHVYSMKIDSTSVVFLDIIKCLQYSYLSFFFLSLSTHTEIFLLQIKWFPLCLACGSYGVDVKMLLEHTADHRMLYILCRVCCEHTLYSFFAILHILLCSFFFLPFSFIFFHAVRE
jgi:hypothetical protein